ncbi:unnamed protein product [Mytilus coruscus]|uniref:Uncharacterized protein n=1 Tax=Mytilus coruscus TaxID=42192 RepID=A0A6J8CJ67_MYTCO|nr:unnamed protein product [Mytilus coruscus]
MDFCIFLSALCLSVLLSVQTLNGVKTNIRENCNPVSERRILTFSIQVPEIVLPVDSILNDVNVFADESSATDEYTFVYSSNLGGSYLLESAENSVVCLNCTEKDGVNLGDSLLEPHNLGDSYNLVDSDLHNLGQSDSYYFGDLSNTAESNLSLILETKTLASFEEYAVNYDTTLKSSNKALMTSTPKKIPVISEVADISDDNYDFGLFDYSVTRTLVESEPAFGISSSEHESSCYMSLEINTRLRSDICTSSPYEFNEDDTETLHLASTEILSLSSGFEGMSYLVSSRSGSNINENFSVYSDASIGMAEMYHDVRATFPQEETKPLLESQLHPERSRLLTRHTKVASIQKDLKSCSRCCSETNSFSKCTVCTSLERQIETTHDAVMREKLRAERREHNSRQMYVNLSLTNMTSK